MKFNTLSGLLVVLFWSTSVRGYGDDGQTAEVQELVDSLCDKRLESGHYYAFGKVPVEGYCNLYVQCDAKQNSLEVCPVGFFFSGYNGCAESHLAYCSYDLCHGKRDGHMYDDKETCDGFFVCMGNLSHYRQCDDGYRFSSSVCVPDNTCRNQFHIDYACDDYQYLASPFYLGSYFQRVPGGSYVQRPCPPGLVFDTSVCVCNYYGDGAGAGNGDGEIYKGNECLGKEHGYLIGDGETCGGFTVCLGGHPYYRRCDDGFRFSSTGCVPDDTCRNDISTPFSGCDQYQYLASPFYPGVYFQRVPGGDYIERPCPAGLVFDTSVCVCNYPDQDRRRFKPGEVTLHK